MSHLDTVEFRQQCNVHKSQVCSQNKEWGVIMNHELQSCGHITSSSVAPAKIQSTQHITQPWFSCLPHCYLFEFNILFFFLNYYLFLKMTFRLPFNFKMYTAALIPQKSGCCVKRQNNIMFYFINLSQLVSDSLGLGQQETGRVVDMLLMYLFQTLHR